MSTIAEKLKTTYLGLAGLTTSMRQLLSVGAKEVTSQEINNKLNGVAKESTLEQIKTMLNGADYLPNDVYDYLASRLEKDYLPSPSYVLPKDKENVPANLALLNSRNMYSGATTDIEYKDGYSLARFLTDSSVGNVISLTDNNIGWVMDTKLPDYPILEELTLGCARMIYNYNTNENHKHFISNATLKKINLPYLKEVRTYSVKQNGIINATAEVNMEQLETIATAAVPHSTSNYGTFVDILNKEVYLPNLKNILETDSNAGKGNIPTLINSGYVESIYIPLITNLYGNGRTDTYSSLAFKCQNLKKLVVGKLTSFNCFHITCYAHNTPMQHLIHLEIGQDTAISLKLEYWVPSEGIANKRDEFLFNFRKYLFLRLANRTDMSSLTISLSTDVYTAISTETRTLAELGVTELTELEISAGVTLDTPYNEWLDTYRAAINWTIAYA